MSFDQWCIQVKYNLNQIHGITLYKCKQLIDCNSIILKCEYDKNVSVPVVAKLMIKWWAAELEIV